MTPICMAPGHQTDPAIDGDNVVWQDARDGSWAGRGSYVVLDTDGSSCWMQYSVTVRSGGTAILQTR